MVKFRDGMKNYQIYRYKIGAIYFFGGFFMILLGISTIISDMNFNSLYGKIFFSLVGLLLFSWGIIILISESFRPGLILTEDYLSSPYVPSNDLHYMSIFRNKNIDIGDIREVVYYKRPNSNRFLFKLPNEKEIEVLEKHLDDKDMFLSTLKKILEKKGIPFYNNVHSR